MHSASTQQEAEHSGPIKAEELRKANYLLDCIVGDLSNAAILVDMIDPELDGPGMRDAKDWLRLFVSARVEELQSALLGHRPRWGTDSEARDRAELFASLPTLEEWLVNSPKPSSRSECAA